MYIYDWLLVRIGCVTVSSLKTIYGSYLPMLLEYMDCQLYCECCTWIHFPDI